MNKSYIIFPLILLGIFGFIYKGFIVEHAEKEAAEELALQAEAERKVADKIEAERQSREDANRRTAEREADQAQKLAANRTKSEAAALDFADETAKAHADSDKYQKEIAALELKLATLRDQRKSLTNDTFTLMKTVETARIAARNAELEVQRMARMVSRKAATSVLVKAPIPPPPPSRR